MHGFSLGSTALVSDFSARRNHKDRGRKAAAILAGNPVPLVDAPQGRK